MTESSLPKVQIRAINEDFHIDLGSEMELLRTTQPRVLRDLRYAIHSPENFQKFVATHEEKVVGHLSARIFGKIGWLAAAQISHEYQRKGIFNNLRIEAERWLASQGVEDIRVAIASDSLKIRNMFERKSYSPIAFAIEPNIFINPEDIDRNPADHFSLVSDTQLFERLKEALKSLNYNIMIDAAYVPLTADMWKMLLSEKRVYTDITQKIFIIVSPVYAPMVFQGFIVADSIKGYGLAARALQAFAAKEDATEIIAHAPSCRESALGLANAGFSWSHPYSVIVYQKSKE